MSNRKKILITIDWFLPGTLSGGPVRSYTNLIEHLKDDFEFYIITRNTDYGLDEQPYKDIEPNTWTTLNDYTYVYYMSKNELNTSHLKRVISECQYDVAYINGIYSWWFSILPISILKKQDKHIIISARGMLNPQAFSVKGFKKKVFLRIAKTIGLYKGVSFHATNSDESLYIKENIGQKAEVSIAPNLPRKAGSNSIGRKILHAPVRFVNVARISIEKGTLTMLEVLKNINKPLVLDLYGPVYDAIYWEKCKAVIKELPNTIQVNYKGVVESESIPKTLQDYDFFVLLSEGENFGHAILEGLSAGCPVLISNLTPWKDLNSQHLGWDVDIKKTSEIVTAFNEALDMSKSQYNNWSKAAFDYAHDFIDNPKVLEQNKALFLSALNKSK